MTSWQEKRKKKAVHEYLARKDGRIMLNKHHVSNHGGGKEGLGDREPGQAEALLAAKDVGKASK